MNDWFPRLNRNTCIGCGECIAVCPTSALGQVGDKAALVSPGLCTYCAACETICPVGAIELPYLICRIEDCYEQAG